MTRPSLGLLALLAALPACQPLRLPPPASLEAAPAWPLEAAHLAWNPQRRLGPYAVQSLDMGEVEQVNGLAEGIRGKSYLRRRYEFEVAADSGARKLWRVRCETTDSRHSLPLGPLGTVSMAGTLALDCTIRPRGGADDAGEPWSLQVTADGTTMPTGELRQDNHRYAVSGEGRQGAQGVARYLITRSSVLFAAADRYGEPVVRLLPYAQVDDPALPAAVALLFHDPLGP